MSAAESTPPLSPLVVEALVDSPFQPFGRSSRDVEGLAQAITASGLLAPPVVRPLVNGRFEIVEGHRRREALRLLGWTTVGCIVRDLSDQECAIIVLAGNGQRLDLAPLEETAIIAQLVERGLGVEAVAEKIGKSVAIVRRRLLLAKLSEEAKAALHGGKLTLFAAEQLATLEDPTSALDALRSMLYGVESKGFEPMGQRGARDVVDRFRLTLSSAPWGLQDTTLGAPACVACPKRTGAQGALFEEGVEGADRCLDRACYEAKLSTYRSREPSDDGNAGDGGRDEPEKPTKSRSTPAAAPTPPPKPAVDFERQARLMAIERAQPLIAKALASPKRKLDEASLSKLFKLYAGFVVRRARSASEGAALDAVFDRRGFGAMSVDTRLTTIGAMKSAHEVLGLVGELLVALDADWTGEPTCETSIAAAARFCKVDLAQLKSEALIELQREAAPKPEKKPKPAKVEPLVEAPPVAVDQRVKVRAGDFAGRVGVVEELLSASAVVLLDRVDGERGRARRPTIAFANLEPFEPSKKSSAKSPLTDREEAALEADAKAMLDAMPTPPNLAAECPRCHAAPGEPCKRQGGGTHAERGKVSVKPPLDAACGACGAEKGVTCTAENGRATKPHTARVEASMRARQTVIEGAEQSAKPAEDSMYLDDEILVELSVGPSTSERLAETLKTSEEHVDAVCSRLFDARKIRSVAIGGVDMWTLAVSVVVSPPKRASKGKKGGSK